MVREFPLPTLPCVVFFLCVSRPFGQPFRDHRDHGDSNFRPGGNDDRNGHSHGPYTLHFDKKVDRGGKANGKGNRQPRGKGKDKWQNENFAPLEVHAAHAPNGKSEASIPEYDPCLA